MGWFKAIALLGYFRRLRLRWLTQQLEASRDKSLQWGPDVTTNMVLERTCRQFQLSRRDRGPVTHLDGQHRQLLVHVELHRIPNPNRESRYLRDKPRPRYRQYITLENPESLLPLGLRLVPKTMGTESPNYLTGDDFFDKQVIIHGPEIEALAFLSAEIRAAVLNLGGQLTIADHKIVWQAPRAPVFLEQALRSLLSISHHLTAIQHSHIRALQHQVEKDPNAGVRFRSFQTLSRHFADSPILLETARTVLTDRFPDLRFVAAMTLEQNESRPVLIQLLQSPSLPHSQRLTIIEKFIDEPEIMEAPLIELLQRSLSYGGKISSTDTRSLISALQFLGSYGSIQAIPTVQKYDDTTISDEISSVAKRSFAKLLQRHPQLGTGHVSLTSQTSGAMSYPTTADCSEPKEKKRETEP
ncbi:MAG: hypothetical protein KTR25_10525 [Myxococcales bacterium]|nr:hypothetical protein [Myxococcales bacterium]